jgi:hypothetical protein
VNVPLLEPVCPKNMAPPKFDALQFLIFPVLFPDAALLSENMQAYDLEKCYPNT